MSQGGNKMNFNFDGNLPFSPHEIVTSNLFICKMNSINVTLT